MKKIDFRPKIEHIHTHILKFDKKHKGGGLGLLPPPLVDMQTKYIVCPNAQKGAMQGAMSIPLCPGGHLRLCEPLPSSFLFLSVRKVGIKENATSRLNFTPTSSLPHLCSHFSPFAANPILSFITTNHISPVRQTLNTNINRNGVNKNLRPFGDWRCPWRSYFCPCQTRSQSHSHQPGTIFYPTHKSLACMSCNSSTDSSYLPPPSLLLFLFYRGP
jgi:hypothetical protein